MYTPRACANRETFACLEVPRRMLARMKMSWRHAWSPFLQRLQFRSFPMSQNRGNKASSATLPIAWIDLNHRTLSGILGSLTTENPRGPAKFSSHLGLKYLNEETSYTSDQNYLRTVLLPPRYLWTSCVHAASETQCVRRRFRVLNAFRSVSAAA